MLKLNLDLVFKAKCISDGRVFLVNKNWPYGKARKLTDGTCKGIIFENAEDLCYDLNCGFVDFLEYIPDKGRLIKGLVPLIRNGQGQNWLDRIKDKTPEEITWMMEQLDELERIKKEREGK